MKKSNSEWILCPICGNKTRTMIRKDTELINFPLYCPKCKQENLINAKDLQVTVVKGIEKTQSDEPNEKFRVYEEDIVSLNIAETFELLFDKNNNVAYKALQKLQKESEETDCVYPYMDRLSDMLDSDNSYVRTRGLTLLAYNAKWDKDYKIDEIIDKYLKHITDVKPITARQCIKLLPIIAKYKPEFKNDILSALYKANISVYDDSMQPLVYKDIQKALKAMQKL